MRCTTLLLSLLLVAGAALAANISASPAFPAAGDDKTTSDEPWAEGFDLPGFDGTVNAVCEFQGGLFVGGQFRTFGSVDAENLAYFDGTRWWGFEERFGYAVGLVNCMVVHDGRLVIGGEVGVEGPAGYSRYIVGFDGTVLHGYDQGFSGKPKVLLDLDGTLVVGGDLWYTGDNSTTLKHLARWTGASWVPYGAGMNGAVQALCEFEGDLVIGGHFSTADNVDANGIARWTGATFEPISGWTGSGIGNVNALLVHGGDLFAGGNFTTLEGVAANRLIRWDGAAWSEVGGGVTSTDYTCFVQSLHELDGDVLVGGRFQQAGGLATTGAVLWTGTAFVEMDGGIDKPGYDGGVVDTAYWDGSWWMGGWFTRAGGQVAHRIVRWDGVRWQPVPLTEGAGLEKRATALCIWNGDLIAAGDFTAAGSTLANHIARWDGTSWQALGDGLDGGVSSLAVWNGDLIVSGGFLQAGKVSCRHIARWDGTAWHDMAGGLSGEAEVMMVAMGGLYVGGALSDAGGASVQNIARWNGTVWSSPGGGVDGPVRAMLPWEGDLLVGGDFLTAGGVSAGHLATWNGASWREFGAGADGNVYALADYGGVVAGGEFMDLGGVSCSRIGRWDGASWHQLGDGFVPQECMMIGPDEWDCWNIFVTDMAVSEGRLFVSGITQSGALVLNSLACWTDYEHWTPLGSGLSWVNAICPDLQKLWVGGGFSPLEGNPASNVASWDIDRIPTQGDQQWWAGFDEQGLDAAVNSLAEFDGDLVAAGYFTDIGGVPVGGVAAWDGSSWTPMGDGFGRFGLNRPIVSCLRQWNGDLYACGLFSLPPATDNVSFARWNGSQWEPLLDANYPERVYEMVPYGDELMLIGSFTEVQGVPASGLARYDGVDFTVVPAATSRLDGYSSYKLGAVVHGGDLVVYGRFDTLAGIPCGNLARWNGTSWLSDSDGFRVTGEVRDAVSQGGDLYVGGMITAADGNPVGGVAKWNGMVWSDLDGGLGRAGGFDPQVWVMEPVNSEIVFTGYFDLAAGTPCSYDIVSWDGTGWNSFGSGFVLDPSPKFNAMTLWDSDLYVGGSFGVAGDKNSSNIARWMLPDPSAEPGAVPAFIVRLDEARPNPFNPGTFAPFELTRPARVNLAIHDLRGRRIRTLIDASLEAATYRAYWDGRDDRGAAMPSGIYFMRLSTDGVSQARKLVLIR